MKKRENLRKTEIAKHKLKFKEKVWYEDLAFTLKAIINSNSFAFINEPLYDYLIREGSTMNNSNVKRNLEIFDAFDDILSYIKHNKKEEYFNKIEFLAIDHIYISAIVRVLKADADKKIKSETINELICYMNKNFPDYKNNEYIQELKSKIIELKQYKEIDSLILNKHIYYDKENMNKYKETLYGLINLIFKMKKG